MPKLGRRGEFASTAPFGTNDTPTFRPRIIGGNIINVIESPGNTSMDPFSNINISEKPNYVDPRVLNDFTKRYSQPYQDPFHKRGDQNIPTYIPKRPDSKDISTRYPTLAPIEGNRIRNQQMSTVFEPEVWTTRYEKEMNLPFLGRGNINNNNSTSLENNYSTNADIYESQGFTVPETGESGKSMSDEKFKARLMSMIPKGMFLPEAPIYLSQTDETRLLNILTSELYNADPVKLRDVYLDISNTVDKQLSGCCQYQDLYQTFCRVSFQFPPDLLQLVAAMFVSNNRRQRDVNYEKFLSFVGAALKNKDRIKPPLTNQGNQYYYDNSTHARKHSPVRHRPGSPFFPDGGDTKLLRMVEQQLTENEFVIDLERLVTSFQTEDRDFRGTLSADQIKNICFQHRIPIQESLITSLLHKCHENNRDEQFNWWTFVRLLERVQPVKTGLPIPLSKRPLEHARVLPSPVASWPKAEAQSPGRNSRATWIPEVPMSYRLEEVPDANREIISRMENELRDLERHYEELKFKPPHKQEGSWFKNFMKFADALYRQDDRFEGSLPFSEVAEWTKMYNKTFQLDIPESEISTALSLSTRKGKVDIHKFLSLIRKH